MPYSGTRCLVSCGEGYRDLTMIVDAAYEFTGSELVLTDHQVKHTGKWLRLGHRRPDGTILYSDGDAGPHQPFEHTDGSVFATYQRKIVRRDDAYVAPWDEYAEVTNPWVAGDTLWFEALPEGARAPDGWQIWKMDMRTKQREFVIDGANPCVYDGKLYFSVWLDESKPGATDETRKGRFLYAIKD